MPIDKKDTEQELWTFLAIPCSLPLRGPLPANYSVPDTRLPPFLLLFLSSSSESSGLGPIVPLLHPILTLFTENIAELTHLDQKFTVCDLGGLPGLIALPERDTSERIRN